MNWNKYDITGVGCLAAGLILGVMHNPLAIIMLLAAAVFYMAGA